MKYLSDCLNTQRIKGILFFITGSNVCVWSSEEWGIITGGNRPTTDTPSWLQVLTLVFYEQSVFYG